MKEALGICEFCERPERTDVECQSGWIELLDGSSMYAPRVGKCLQLLEHQRDRLIQTRTEAFGLNDARFAQGWADLETTEESWRAARGASKSIWELVEQGVNVIAYGPPGRGKTHASVLICRDAVRAGLTVVKASWPHVLSSIRESFGKGYVGLSERQQLDVLIAPDLLLLDDIGAGGSDENGSGFSRSRLELVVTARYERRKPCIVTTNNDPSTWDLLLGERVHSRLRGSSLLLKFGGRAYRLETERQNSSALVKKILANARNSPEK